MKGEKMTKRINVRVTDKTYEVLTEAAGGRGLATLVAGLAEDYANVLTSGIGQSDPVVTPEVEEEEPKYPVPSEAQMKAALQRFRTHLDVEGVNELSKYLRRRKWGFDLSGKDRAHNAKVYRYLVLNFPVSQGDYETLQTHIEENDIAWPSGEKTDLQLMRWAIKQHNYVRPL